MVLFAAFLSALFVYVLVSRRLEPTILTPPIVFTSAGALLGLSPEAWSHLALDRHGALLLAELGLVMTLFSDASRIRPAMLKGHPNLPGRLLSTGMLLTIALGVLGAVLVLDGLSWWEAGIVAAVLAPTDAGLGQVIVKSRLVPRRIREALNVEAGLNDGLSVPFLTFFMVLAAAQGESVLGSGVFPRLILEQLVYGALVGLGVGLVGGLLLGFAYHRAWVARPLVQLGVVVLPLASVLLSEAVAASMFIAAFVAGLAAQVGFAGIGKHSVEFTEGWGQLFNFFVFFLFGLFVARHGQEITLAVLLYAVLSLTLVRMLPVAIALRGTGLSAASVLFMGWFGPRGLGSIVLGLIYVERHMHLPGQSVIRSAVLATVLLSIFAHGLTAAGGIKRYSTIVGALDKGAAEHGDGGTGGDRAEHLGPGSQ